MDNLTLSEIRIISSKYANCLLSYHQNNEDKETVEHIEKHYLSNLYIISDLVNHHLRVIKNHFEEQIKLKNDDRVCQLWHTFKNSEDFSLYKFTFISLCAENNSLDLIKFFLHDNDGVLNYHFYPAFLIACEKGYMQIVDYFIHKKIGIDDTPICASIKSNQLEVLKRLISNRGTYHERNFHRALRNAADNGYIDIILYALEELQVEPVVLLETNNHITIDFIDNFLNKKALNEKLNDQLSSTLRSTTKKTKL